MRSAVAVPFSVHIEEEVLIDLRARLLAGRFPDDLDNDDWRYGASSAYMRELRDYWCGKYDWRAQERAINELAHFRTEIDDVPIHFVHQRGRGPAPLPIVLTHGWPSTFWDYRKVIGPLTDPAAYGGDPLDAFDVVVPSLPGFIFSTPLPRSGVTWVDTADMWAILMRERLGYERFGAAGADWGTAISSQLGHKYADRLIGIHIVDGRLLSTWNVERPWDVLGALPPGLTSDERERVLAWQRRHASHVSVHVLGAQTLASALHDSPLGLCAWIVERWRSWSDCAGQLERRFSKDDLLTTVMLYWATDSFVTSARYYREAATHPWEPSNDGAPTVGVPTAVSVFRPEAARIPTEEWLAKHFNLHQFRIHDRGGHFAPAEEPDAIVQDIRDAFRSLR